MKVATLDVRVTPRASKSEIVGLVDGTLRVRVTAPAVEGKANRAVVSLMARALGVRARHIDIVRGEHSRNKLVWIEGLSLEDVLERLGLGS